MPYPVWQAGMTVTAGLLTAMQPRFVVKSADESLTSSTALQDDNHLILPVDANATYELQAMLFWAGNETGDIKFAFAFPTGATVNWAITGPNAADAGFSTGGTRGGTQYFSSLNQTLSPTGSIDIAGSTSPLHARPHGTVITGVTAGSLTLRWAQNTSNATATTVKAGSWLRLQRHV